MSRRAEAGSDVPVNPMFSILRKLLKELIYTQRFFLNSVLESCPLIQSLSARAVVISASCLLTFLQTETGALPALGSPAGQAALPHSWLQDTVLGIYSLYLYFHYRRRWAAHLCKCSLVPTARGLHSLSAHPHLSWRMLSLQCYVTIPSISLRDLVCHQYVSLEGWESPASSLFYSLTSLHLFRQSHNSSLLLIQLAKLPPLFVGRRHHSHLLLQRE